MALTIGEHAGFIPDAPGTPSYVSQSINTIACATKDTSPAGSNKVTQMGWWQDRASGGGNPCYEMALYSHDAVNDRPNAIIAGSHQTGSNVVGADGVKWYTYGSLNISLVASTIYWTSVGVGTSGGNVLIEYSGLDAGRKAQDDTITSCNLESPWGGTTEDTRIYAIYALYEAAGGISINISDTISIAESIGPAYDRWNLSASDTVAIAEAITAALTILDRSISVADTVSIVETLTVLFDRLNINVSDTISVSELITIIKDVLPNISDSIGVSEAVSLLLAADDVINVSDTVNVVEAITVLFTMLTPSMSDAVSISEIISLILDLLPSISDSVSIAESITVVVSALAAVRRRQGLLLGVYP